MWRYPGSRRKAAAPAPVLDYARAWNLIDYELAQVMLFMINPRMWRYCPANCSGSRQRELRCVGYWRNWARSRGFWHILLKRPTIEPVDARRAEE